MVLIIFLCVFYYKFYNFYNSDKYFFWRYKNKIWSHRVDSIERLKEVIKKVNGVEVDLVYDDKLNIFDVTHPPVKSIGLSFENYLNSVKNINNFGLWLDLKNLNQENKLKIFKRIEYLVKKFNLNKNKIIIESSSVNLLDVFVANDYQCSYYLPILSEIDRSELDKTIKIIKYNLKNEPKLYISSYFKDYEIMKKNFPNRKMLFWALAEKDLPKYKQKWKKILKDKQVKVLLIYIRSKHGHR